MSDLLDAARGVPNACEPVPGLVTGGQPSPAHLGALKAAGCDVVLDIRDPMEPRPYRAPDAVRAAGLEYVNIPVAHGGVPLETYDRIRAMVRDLIAAGRKAFFHCASGNRVGATLIPFLMLDRGLDEDEAMTEAMRIGTRNAELIELALEYVRRERAS
jgi:protein tyrosine phosphatase (PTP) superfamily phosphohydrolase (DUF442 family)